MKINSHKISQIPWIALITLLLVCIAAVTLYIVWYREKAVGIWALGKTYTVYDGEGIRQNGELVDFKDNILTFRIVVKGKNTPLEMSATTFMIELQPGVKQEQLLELNKKYGVSIQSVFEYALPGWYALKVPEGGNVLDLMDSYHNESIIKKVTCDGIGHITQF